jgi:argonaute-like protein implicated in RNA metabolism and viral defense
VALITMAEAYKQLPVGQSPYHRTKAKLLNQRVPSQDILVKNLRHSSHSVENNIALNVYSKLGGTAWTIEKAEKDIPELVIGIGSTIDASGTHIIGFANVFDHNGTYIVGDCSQLSTKQNYANNLENYLVKVIKQAIEMKGIGAKQRLRLLFHLFKGASKKSELTAIRNALKKFSAYSIQYGIAHLSYNHNLRMYLDGGKKQPSRGTFVQISTLQGLLYLGGYGETPLLVRLDKRADYKDLYATTKQVLFFCHLSYRSFKPANKPVTITYPSRMAKIVSELRQLSEWDPDILNMLSDKLWFI